MRVAAAALAIAVVLLLGCGGSDETTVSPPADGGASAAKIRSAWERDPDCWHPRGASRWGCAVGRYRCQGVVTGRGWSVSCARPGHSIGFTVRPD